jgi:ribonuclease T1
MRKLVGSVSVKDNPSKHTAGLCRGFWGCPSKIQIEFISIFILFVCLLGLPNFVYPRQTISELSSSDLSTVVLGELPKEAVQTYFLIQAGGPFPYAKDGTVFFNRERLLPRKNRGAYREYTVPTPGLNHRGARRLVCEVSVQLVMDPCYYTADHYRSFRRVLP